MSKVKVSGICVECGCTENNPCFHPEEGTCWWTDETETLCSHCDDREIRNSPVTKHCIHTAGKYFIIRNTNHITKTSLENDLSELADNISHSIIDDPDMFKTYLQKRLDRINGKNCRCKPAAIWNFYEYKKTGEIKCVLASVSYKVDIRLYPIKKIL